MSEEQNGLKKKLIKAEQALRESEDKYKRLVEKISDITYTINRNGEITYVSPQVRRLGYLPEELIGESIYYLIHPDDIVQGQIPPEFRIKKGDGNYAWVEERSIKSYRKGRLIQITGTLRDITEKKALDEEKDEFISIAIHDLKTPVSIIKAYLKLITSTELPLTEDYKKDCLDSSLRNINELENLIEDLLNSSRATIYEFDFKEQDLVKIINDSVKSVEELKVKGRHSLECSIPDELIIQADGLWIKQLVINLLSNAYKYTPPGGNIKIGIEKNYRFVSLYVADNGVGIPEVDKNRLFKRFSRLDNVLSENVTSDKGTGLGLYICSKITEKHGGKIWVESEGSGKGSKFIVKLPLKQT